MSSAPSGMGTVQWVAEQLKQGVHPDTIKRMMGLRNNLPSKRRFGLVLSAAYQLLRDQVELPRPRGRFVGWAG